MTLYELRTGVTRSPKNRQFPLPGRFKLQNLKKKKFFFFRNFRKEVYFRMVLHIGVFSVLPPRQRTLRSDSEGLRYSHEGKRGED